VGQPVTAGQTVWCRTADGGWWKTTAAGPLTRSIGRSWWLAVPVLGWDSGDPDHPVNWPAEDVRTIDPGGDATNAALAALKQGERA
jgi:hypothetical protein